jgi:hypothetical protein
VDGNPIIIDTDMGQAVKFDGNGDMLTVDAAPVGSATEFTIEVIFKPDGNALNITNQPRFLCFWDPADASAGPRMTIEIRVTASNQWYFDGFLKTDASNLTLIDATKTHPTDNWMHAAVVYQNKNFNTYVNGIQELTGALNYTAKALNTTGKVSLGARFNKTNWYSGIIKTVKITQGALTPAEFITNTIPTSAKNKVEFGDAISIYPNPANKTICFDIPDKTNYGNTFITLFNSSGATVAQSKFKNCNNHIVQMNIENLNNGVYFARINAGGHVFNRMISVLH